MQIHRRQFRGAVMCCLLFGCGGATVIPDPGAGDAAASTDAANGTIVGDGGNSSTAGPGGSQSTLACGDATCSIPAEVCCVYETSPPKFLCVAGAACPAAAGGSGGTALSCSGASNCPSGTVCCVSEVARVVSSQCRVACAKNEAQLCDPTATATGCPSSAACSSNNVSDWGLPTTYATCGGIGN